MEKHDSLVYIRLQVQTSHYWQPFFFLGERAWETFIAPVTVGAGAIKEQMSGVAHLIEDGVYKAGVVGSFPTWDQYKNERTF